MRPIGTRNADPLVAQLEDELFGAPERDRHRPDGPRRRRHRPPVPHRARRHAHDPEPGRRQLPVLGRPPRERPHLGRPATSTTTGRPDATVPSRRGDLTSRHRHGRAVGSYELAVRVGASRPATGWRGCALSARLVSAGRRRWPFTRSRSRSPIAAEILKLRAGDEVIVQGHIIGIRDRTQIRIFDQGVEPPMDLSGAFLLHTAPNVRKLGPGQVREALHRHDDERADGALHRAARRAVRRARDLRQGRLPRRGDRADAAARDGLLRDRRRRRGARDDPDRGDRGGRLGGADARVPLEVPRQGLRPAHRRHRRARQLPLPRRPGSGQREAEGDLCPLFDLDLPAPRRRPHPRDRQGPRPARLGGRPRDERRLHRHRQARLGHRVRDPEPETEARGARRRRRSCSAARFFEVVYAQGQARRVQVAGSRSSASTTSRSPTGRSTSRASASSS